jgi:hypothetical protein
VSRRRSHLHVDRAVVVASDIRLSRLIVSAGMEPRHHRSEVDLTEVIAAKVDLLDEIGRLADAVL